MLLASGVECEAGTIVPIIIDPDAAAADVARTVDYMRKYEQIRKKLNFDDDKTNRFFKTEIRQTMQNFRLPLRNTKDVRFAKYMGVNDMTKANKALVNMLFSQDNLKSDMTVGFKGNPNVGSVVLNQFDDSPEFLNFATEFEPANKIFIISSIFGGTGASGFPLLLKTLRTNTKLPNSGAINKAHIGAITVLPYFKVKQDNDSQIDSATFVSKAKSALDYYNRNISQNNQIDSLYYIADDTRTTYENHEGGQEQKNNAHFVELVSALAILDFARSEKADFATHKEYGLESDSNELIFENLGPETKETLLKSLTQFLLFTKYLKENKEKEAEYLSKPWAKAFDRSFLDSDFVKTLSKFQLEFFGWLNEMEHQDHDRKFTPFELRSDTKKVFDIELIKKIRVHKLLTFDSNYDLFTNRLNRQTATGDKEQKFVEMFYKATEVLVKEKYKIQ